MAILNFSVCKGHAWFWSSRLCLSSFSGHCCGASAVKSASDGQRRVMFFHIMSCVEKFIQRCLSLVTYVHYSFSMILPGRQVAESPRPRLFKPDRPRIFRQQLLSFEKKHFYTRCAGLSVICAPYRIESSLRWCDDRKFLTLLQRWKVSNTDVTIERSLHRINHLSLLQKLPLLFFINKKRSG